MTETKEIAVFRLPEETAPEQRLEALEHELANCAKALDQGDVRSLAGVDVEVSRLCDQVMQMTTADAGFYIQRLQSLSDAFSALGEVMVAQRDDLKGELTELQARQKAHRAYGMRDAANAAANPDANEQE